MTTARIGIRRLRLIEGARAANGHAVIVDVLRAGTSVAYALAGGVARLVLVARVSDAFALRGRRYPDAVLAGESEGRPIEGFDLDNSPAAIERSPLEGRTLIMRTSSGTQGALAVTRAEAVFLAGFVNAGATARLLQDRRAAVASLVAMGVGGEVPAEEDEACAAYIESLLRGRPLPADLLLADVRRRKGQVWEHPAPTFLADVERAFVIDRFDFAVEVRREDGLALAARVPA